MKIIRKQQLNSLKTGFDVYPVVCNPSILTLFQYTHLTIILFQVFTCQKNIVCLCTHSPDRCRLWIWHRLWWAVDAVGAVVWAAADFQVFKASRLSVHRMTKRVHVEWSAAPRGFDAKLCRKCLPHITLIAVVWTTCTFPWSPVAVLPTWARRVEPLAVRIMWYTLYKCLLFKAEIRHFCFSICCFLLFPHLRH